MDRNTQLQSHGPTFRRLKDILRREDAALQLRADPSSLAPERLLVFEVTGSVQNFARAISRINGLEFSGEEELSSDQLDKSPELYLLVPQLSALRQILSLWEQWQRNGYLPDGYAPWRDLFLQLRKIRPWGPSDRVSESNRQYFHDITDGAPDDELYRIEIELVYRNNEAHSLRAEREITTSVTRAGGIILARSRRGEFAYHAVLADIPASELRKIADLDPSSLAGADPIVAIVPQSVGTPIETADPLDDDIFCAPPRDLEPIAAVFDAVPLQAHPLLVDRLSVDDPDDLEALAVGSRIHGTAMSSLVIHGDLNDPTSTIRRRLYFRPVMYAPQFGDECFDRSKLVIDVIVESVIRMRENDGSQVILVNLSLGDQTKPFSGKISTWARALDYLSYEFGILFLVSAGNTGDCIEIPSCPDKNTFTAASSEDKAKFILEGVNAIKADRRILSPADSINSLTIGAWHRDSSIEIFPNPSPFLPYDGQEMPNLSSRLGPGLRRSTKPDVLFAGGRERVRLDPTTPSARISPHPHPSRYAGLKVAAPLQDGVMGQHFTIGSSGATALATHSAHRIFDALEEAYPQLIARMPLRQRAVLLKALLVHSASWNSSEAFIRSVVDPTQSMHHEHWRREVCRYLGYGFVDPEDAIACAGDRATMWATGSLAAGASLTYNVPIPAAITANAGLREVRATLAWFAPIRPGHLAYRAIKLKIASLQKDALDSSGIGTTSSQPTNSQSESGTVIHRRWRNTRIGDPLSGNTIPIQIQRENDQGEEIDDSISFGLAVTIEMPGQEQIYEQVLANIAVKPRAIVRA